MANAITEGADHQLPPDQHGEIVRAPTPAVIALRTEILEAWRHKDAGEGEAMRARSSIESRADLRIAAENEASLRSPESAGAAPAALVDRETARQWADLDAGDFGRIRSAARRDQALDAVAGHMRASPEYAQALQARLPALADAGQALNAERQKQELEASARDAADRREAQIDAAARSRDALIDAAALAAVAATRARETARVVEQLAEAPHTSTAELRSARDAQKSGTPELAASVGAEAAAELSPQGATRVNRRPVTEEELGQALTARYIVTQEKRGLFDRGTTEFTLRSGQDQGKVAFVDAGKVLSTEREDKSTIRAMVEVAVAKHWKELTLTGTDDFRRNAWLEASLRGMQVRGYEPREADRQMLVDLQKQQPQQAQKVHNAMSAAERVPSAEKSAALPTGQSKSTQTSKAAKHVDGDALTAQEKTVLDNSRAILDSKALGEQFTQAALQELEARLRGERVYVGEIVDYGKAPYKFDQKNDESYFVTLRTGAGDQVIWGKGLAEALADRKIGEQIVLQNVGKRAVTVDAGVRNAQGQVIGTRPKESQLNTWKSELLSRYSEKARSELTGGQTLRQPSMRVYDAKAARAQPPAPARQEPAERRPMSEQNRLPRER